ncbi:GNAT family N-acetyltransferase [Parapedobacter koreensis]|uniref:Acetyltransferase (GNAT) family protein n=1 Tax=Parapedobacter koreensis TaxID=332977 RepID=A0A1H7T628_9SPHI|nr:GNAT family N-acetyltransferase [Parapedobacter koreensis]SEL79774.1 Acetyltransferase (GNAT) family protein [Parapedobacter koreensis]
MMMGVKIMPVTDALWPQLEQLFGKSGACNGCWCMYWRIGADYHKRDRTLNKNDLHSIISAGHPSGLLALVDNIAAGWCQLTPKQDLPWLTKNGYGDPDVTKNIWCISCFYIKSAYRKKGLTTPLIKAATEYAQKAKATLLEAYPGNSPNSYTGHLNTFLKLGFNIVGDGKYDRKIVSIRL